MDANRQKTQDLQTAKNEIPIYNNSQQQQADNESYSGASVMTFTLAGRKAMYLPVPVYKCFQGGDVCVRIEVNQSGYVVNANVVSAISAADECLKTAAVSAAKLSRFTTDASASKLQSGTIIYRFVAQ